MNPDTNAVEWVDVIVKLVTMGGFGALVWYLVVRHIPAIEERHRSERHEWRTFIRGRDEALSKVVDDFTDELSESRTELAQLRTEIRGLSNARN
tara:strand:+ start:341 stop:622 length:282 start_codon:yes stop_codon:yes gene_type:complete